MDGFHEISKGRRGGGMSLFSEAGHAEKLAFAKIAMRRRSEFTALIDMAMLLYETISEYEAKEKARSVMIRKYGENWFTGEPPITKEKNNEKD